MEEPGVGAAEVEAVPHRRQGHQPNKTLERLPGSGVPSTLTSHQDPGQGARCTIDGGNKLFSARSRRRVPGKTFSSQSQNEGPTSSEAK